MFTKLIFYFYADNLKVSTIVSIIFFFLNGSNSVRKLALKLRICVRFASTFNVVRVAVLTYDLVICKDQDLVICKDSNDCLYAINDYLLLSRTSFSQNKSTEVQLIMDHYRISYFFLIFPNQFHIVLAFKYILLLKQ